MYDNLDSEFERWSPGNGKKSDLYSRGYMRSSGNRRYNFNNSMNQHIVESNPICFTDGRIEEFYSEIFRVNYVHFIVNAEISQCGHSLEDIYRSLKICEPLKKWLPSFKLHFTLPLFHARFSQSRINNHREVKRKLRWCTSPEIFAN